MFVATTLWLASVSSVAAVNTHFVYWNSTNPLFRIDNTEHVMDVNQENLPWEYDQLNIICPFGTSERHIIYSVTKEEFDSCRVSNPRPKIVAVCDRPERFKYFTITFRSFSPTPGGLEFRPGQSYYFVSTSTRRDIHRRVGGYCATDHMKMIFNVGHKKNSAGPTNHPRRLATTTQAPRHRPSLMYASSYPIYQQVGDSNMFERDEQIYFYTPWRRSRPGHSTVVSAEKLVSSSSQLASSLSFLFVFVFSSCIIR